MLYGNIEQLALIPYVDGIIKSLIKEAIGIAEHKNTGKYELSLPGTFLIVSEGQTGLSSNQKAEVHKKYIDVQILLQGQEEIGYSNEINSQLTEADHFPNDILFPEFVAREQFIILNPGDFVLFYPHQIHRPLCTRGKPSVVKKAIIKIPASVFSESVCPSQENK